MDNRMLTVYDYSVIAFYFAFMAFIGFVFRKYSKNDSDYFRGGAMMLWWMVGASAFMTQFSAWTFTGAASKAYQNGTLVAVIFFANAPFPVVRGRPSRYHLPLDRGRIREAVHHSEQHAGCLQVSQRQGRRAGA